MLGGGLRTGGFNRPAGRFRKGRPVWLASTHPAPSGPSRTRVGGTEKAAQLRAAACPGTVTKAVQMPRSPAARQRRRRCRRGRGEREGGRGVCQDRPGCPARGAARTPSAAQSRAAPRPPAPPSPPGPPGPSCPWGLPGSPACLFPTYSSSDFYRSARVISIKGRLRFSVAERSSSFHSLKVPSAPRPTPRRCRGSRAVGQAALGASPASPRPDSPGRRRVSARTILSSATARLLGFRARAESCSSHRGFCDLAGQNRYALRLADVPFPPHLRLHVTFIGFKV